MKRIVVEHGHPFCRVVRGAKYVTPVLKVRDPKAEFRRARAPSWVRDSIPDDVWFFDYETGEFPSGLFQDVVEHLRKSGRPFKIRYPNGKPTPVSSLKLRPDMLFGVSMTDKYDYQFDSVKAAIEAMCGWLWLATNAGKSYIAAAICLYLFEMAGYKSLIVVPNKGLLYQLVKDLQKLCGARLRVGMIGDGHFKPGDITVATAQTLIKGIPKNARAKYNRDLNKIIKTRKVLLIDEGHHASADTWQRLLGASPAVYRLGLSGTVKDKNDPVKDFTLKAYLGPVIKRVRNSELMARGVSAKAHVFCVTANEVFQTNCTSPKWETDRRGNFVLDGQGQRIRRPGQIRYKEEIDALIADKHYNSSVVALCQSFIDGGLKPLVLTTRISHLEQLKKMMEKKGMVPLSVWGDVPGSKRLRIVRDFTRQQSAVLLGSTVLDEGFNAPAVGVMILASGGKSVRQTLQRVGRAVRSKSRGLNAVAVVDMSAHNGEYLSKHTMERLAIFQQEKFRVREVTDLDVFCRKARRGWKGLLGKKRYAKELEKQEQIRAKYAPSAS